MLQHIETAVRTVKSVGIKVVASTLITRFNYKSMKELYNKCNELGFDFMTLNYPETSLSPTYPLGGEAVNLTNEEIVYGLKDVLSLKRSGYRIFNPIDCLKNAIAYFGTGKGNYACWGGNKVLFVDWFLDLYPCMHMAEPLGPVLSITKADLYVDKCNACGMSWYRDLSIYLQGLKSVAPLARSIKDLIAQ